ncbi:ABC transporter ATP-binding protein [Candidatus Bipolaricaulota bacterium]|nr:ABC transporter ATP-binding protein [Candidatus Bipolaricaulota bacterium]
MAEVRLNNVTKMFGDLTAVDSANLTIEDSEFIVLVGPSGCGKTTTLRCVAGLEEPTKGEVYIGDEVVNGVPPKDRDIAMVFQNYALYPHMDVYNNIAFGLKLRKLPKDEIEERVNRTAELLGIHDKLDSKPKELSGGQRQRVAVGRAIARNPKVFLFDEPLSNLDAKLRVQMRAELQELHHNLETTSMYVTHDQVEAMTLGNRVAVIDEGIIQQYAAPQEIYDYPSNKFVAGFIGSPSMNFLDARIKEEDGNIYVEGDGFNLLLTDKITDQLEGMNGKDITFGVRPEDLTAEQTVHEGDRTKSFDTHVLVTEPLGDEIIVHAEVGDQEIVAQLDPRVEIEPHQDVTLFADMDYIHIFDKETEEALV